MTQQQVRHLSLSLMIRVWSRAPAWWMEKTPESCPCSSTCISWFSEGFYQYKQQLLGYEFQNKGKKKKNWKVGLYQTKKLLYNKWNNWQSEETTYRMRENICRLFISEGNYIQGINKKAFQDLKKKDQEANLLTLLVIRYRILCFRKKHI